MSRQSHKNRVFHEVHNNKMSNSSPPVEPAAGGARPVYSPDVVLAQLAGQPEPHCQNHQFLLKAHQIQAEMVRRLQAKEAAPSQQILVEYVQVLYLTISALPGAIRYSQLEMTIIKSGLLAPFIMDVDIPTKRLEIGLPTTPATCDTTYELMVVVMSAFCCFWHYLNFKHVENSVPSDDAALMLSTLAIRSLSKPELCDILDADLSAQGIQGFGSKECRWLMHYVRSELMGWFASVQYLLGDERCQESLVAQQQDRLTLIKQVPDNVLGYLLYTRSCIQFQQHRPAHVFASKALVIAEAKDETVCRPQLMCIRALAAVLGGAGPTYIPKTIAEQLIAARQELKNATEWLPAPYHDLLRLGPEAGAISDSVLGIPEGRGEQTSSDVEDAGQEVMPGAPQWESSDEELLAVANCSEIATAVAEESVYVMPVPKELPMGAITQLQQQAMAAEAAAAAVPAGPAKGKTGAAKAKK